MASISYRLTNLMDAGVLVLGNESWTRKLPTGSNWSKIRFGFLATVGRADSRAANVVDWGLTFGVCTSFGAGGGSYSCPNMVGFCPANPTPGSITLLTYQVGPFQYFHTTGVNPQAFVRLHDNQLGPTWILVASATTACGFAPDQSMQSIPAAPKRNGIYVVDIQRGLGGAGTATMTFYYLTGAQIQTGVYMTEADLMDAINVAGTPILQGITLTATAGLSVAVSDVTGPLDSLFISHNKDGYPINIQAMAACVHWDQIQPLISGANDLFQNYGTQNFPPWTTSGSMSSGEWYGTDATTAWTIYGTGWVGPSMAPQALAGTTMVMPYDPFVQYVVQETPLTTEISAGTGWSSSAFFVGTDANLASQSGLAGTSVACPFDLMVQYIVTGGTFTGSTMLSAGTGWATYGTISGTDALAAPAIGLQGTSAQCPLDLMVQYIVTGGTFCCGSVLSAGTGWATYGTVSGTDATFAPAIGLQGTSTTCPFDLMRQYEPGAVTSGVTINAGTGWSGAGIVR